jgi:hypothetical protein
VQEIVVVPGATAVIRPPALTVATDGSEDDHVAFEVTSSVAPSASTAVAVNCADEPVVIGPLTGLANEILTASTFCLPGFEYPVSPQPAIPLNATARTAMKVRKFLCTRRS